MVSWHMQYLPFPLPWNQTPLQISRNGVPISERFGGHVPFGLRAFCNVSSLAACILLRLLPQKNPSLELKQPVKECQGFASWFCKARCSVGSIGGKFHIE
mmetsp:Transcript_20542/g.37331  ORF Transcript_20542/g.37331 Transcript_20542/m.37331 type:complete len:100 (-) Transcript_20542:194-493(-)